MTRTLYRAYLYVVTVGMLIFAAVGLYLILDALLRQTSLAGPFAAPMTRPEAVQSMTFGALAWLIAGALGGFHYWLIRRDMRKYPEAGESAVRSLFLNGNEAIAAIVAVIAAVAFTSQLATDVSQGIDVSTLSVAVTALTMTTVLELERRRARPARGAALVFQRLHEYGAPLVLLLFVATSAWQQAISRTTLKLIATGDPESLCNQYGACPPVYRLGFLWLAAALVSLGLAWYALLVWRDTHSSIRQFLHLAAFGFGIIFLTIGVQGGLELALRGVFNLGVQRASVADMVGSLGFGLLAAVAVGLWLRQEADDLPMGSGAVGLSAQAIASAVLAVPFWWGAGMTLRYLVERSVPAGAALTRSDLAFALSLLVAGVFYAPLALDLRRRTELRHIAGPRRALTLGLLAAGVIAGAVGIVTALYAVGTKLLGSPLASWQGTARTGTVVLIVGAGLAALYVWRAIQEHAFGPIQLHPAPHVAPPLTPAQPHDAIDVVLDEFAAGELTHENAADRLRELTHVGS